MPMDKRHKTRRHNTASRRHTPRDITAVGVKYLISRGEHKVIHVQFGMIQTMYLHCLRIALDTFAEVLEFNENSRVWWDQTPDALRQTAALTFNFVDIPNVIGMINGMKLPSSSPADPLLQNRDYNSWTKEVNRNVMLLWHPDGTIIDCVINAPGSFHDSRTTKWGAVYDHIAKLPDPYLVVCDDAFVTHGILKGKLVETNFNDNDNDNEKTEHDKSLTHLRQCSEWGNNDWTKVFRRLQNKLPTNNVTRARLLWSCVFVHNFRVNTVGRSQIRSYFEFINSNDNN